MEDIRSIDRDNDGLLDEIRKSVMTQQGHIETQQHEQYFAYVDSLITGHAKPFVQMPSAQIEGIDRTFFSLAIRSKIYVSFFGRYSKGIRADLWDLSPFALTSIPFVVPPLSAQRSIVSDLDAKCSKIVKLIANITKEIECIKEYKQRLISDVVTGQIKVC